MLFGLIRNLHGLIKPEEEVACRRCLVSRRDLKIISYFCYQ